MVTGKNALTAVLPALAGFALVTTGCAMFFRAPKPIRQFPVHESGSPSRTLVVLLPGRYGPARDFLRYGFDRSLAEIAPYVDAIGVEASFGYYARRTLVTRLHDDVIAPARARGYRRIFIAGISMGGLGAALYDRYGPGDVDGIVLLSPFLGDDEVLDEIEKAGGVAAWQPREPLGAADYQREIWTWLKKETDGSPSRAAIYLGYATEDRLVRGQRMLAERLPSGHVFTTGGGHTWEPWKELWRQFLMSNALAP